MQTKTTANRKEAPNYSLSMSGKRLLGVALAVTGAWLLLLTIGASPNQRRQSNEWGSLGRGPLTNTLPPLRRVGSTNADRSPVRRLQSRGGGFRSPCGTAEELSYKVGRCLDPVFELVEGRFEDPKSDVELQAACSRFNSTERCVRVIAKDCLTGLHKTSTGSVASATKRFRAQECKSAPSRARYQEPLRCALRKGKESAEMYRNHTGIAQGIRDLPDTTPEEKLMKLCCLLNSLDKEIERSFNRDCPKSTPLVLGIVHAMTDDARSTLCVAPKCHKALDKVIRRPYQPSQNFIEPVMQILFELNTN